MNQACTPSGERGFALLMLFVMAAVIAITLYMEMPRVAFESQRAKEQLLVDRGNEYKRGIQLFYRKFKRFPAKIDDLETTNNIRFLRRRYKDPMTGKDEWRLIHVGPGGFLTDSLVQKPPNPLGKDSKDVMAGSSSPGNTPMPGDQTATGQPPQPLNANGTEGGGINMALARRPSDQMTVGSPGAAGGAGFG
ncbi:MAG: type II secretion system GspH family protein, partial [Acidobacteriota bacterium]|nr:type II secretion system GspH family protein [Acidobacteriota bacterium]